MAQFDVFENGDDHSKGRIPFLLDVQHDLLASLATHVVIPLARPEVLNLKGISRLTPTFEVEGQPLVMLTPEMAGVPTGVLGRRVSNLADHRTAIVDALDLLFTGV